MNYFPRYLSKEIRATKEAADELWQLKKDLWDVRGILIKGYPCSASRRKPNIQEMCLQRGREVYKAVVADCSDYWLLIHFGKFTHARR